MAEAGNWKRWALEKKVLTEFTAGVAKPISPLDLQGATSRDGSFGGRKSTTASPRKILLVPHAA